VCLIQQHRAAQAERVSHASASFVDAFAIPRTYPVDFTTKFFTSAWRAAGSTAHRAVFSKLLDAARIYHLARSELHVASFSALAVE
jgi:hypothetical protein